jgi:hypothetical protein
VFGAVVDLSKWLIDKLGPSPAALIVVFILLIGGGGIFYVMRNDPVLLTTKYLTYLQSTHRKAWNN